MHIPSSFAGCLAAFFLAGASASLSAETFFVNFATGDDAGDGSEQSPWKHASGDPQADGTAALTILEPGDVLQFRGGVVYRGGIDASSSGTPEDRIVYRGSGWGEGRAILDGSEIITGWKKCTSAAEAGGREQFSDLYWTEVEADSPFLLNLHESDPKTGQDEFLVMAQDPNPEDPFFFDRRDSFYPVTHANLTQTSLTAPEIFNQSDAGHWRDGYVLLWVNPNFTKRFKIQSFDPETGRIGLEDIGKNSIYQDGRDQSFAIYNSVHAIDRPGEFAICEPGPDGKRRIVLWPRSLENLDTRISRSVRENGFNLSGQSGIEIDGFEIRKYAGEVQAQGSAIFTKDGGQGQSNGLLIRNNLITHNMSGSRGYGGIFLSDVTGSVVENNEVTWNKGHRGIFITKGDDIILRKNRVEYPGATAVGVYTGKRIQILDNDISHIYATHANAVTLYIACENILVAGNRITDATNPITFQDSGPLYFIGNITDGGDLYKNVNEWGNTRRGPWAIGRIVFLNNTFVKAQKNCSLNLGKDKDKSYVVINNILNGLTFGKKDAPLVHNHNIYTGLSSMQASRYGWEMGEGETEDENLADLVVNPEKGDFQVRPGSYAAKAGADVSEYLPTDVFPDVDFPALIGGTNPPPIGAVGGDRTE